MGKASSRKRRRIKCDFCSDLNPKWAYRTEHDPTEQGATKPGKGAWAACDTCKDLIERGRHDDLAMRSLKATFAIHPQIREFPAQTLLPLFKELHDGFRRCRVGPVMTAQQYERQYAGQGPLGMRMDEFMQEEGLNIMMGKDPRPGDAIGKPVPNGQAIFRHVSNDPPRYAPEGFTIEQLSDPRTVEYLMGNIQRDRPTPNIPLTIPTVQTIKQWVGARTYLDACAGVYGECPRPDDTFDPSPSMMVAQRILEPLLGAHPLVLEPEQMNAIDTADWSFAEAIDYAKIAHLPFEPLYLDFGGHQPVTVDLTAGPCRLYGAVIWRSGFFKTPTLAIAPIGGYDYLTGPFTDYMLARGADAEEIKSYAGTKHPLGESAIHSTTFERYTIDRKQVNQWRYQPAGICWMGIETHELSGPYVDYEMSVRQQRGVVGVSMVFSTGTAIARVTDDPRLKDDPGHTEAQILTGLHAAQESSVMYSADGWPEDSHWLTMANLATEMVAKLTERALLGLYFIENAPIAVEEIPLSRPERREIERERKKGREPGPMASIVLIKGRRSEGGSGNGFQREHEYRWERRGYFTHYHENNRHYQNRPDLVKPCHKCAYEYALNERARRDGKDIPYPFTESPDCIKKWVWPTVCGPEDKPLKKKVRIRQRDRRAA